MINAVSLVGQAHVNSVSPATASSPEVSAASLSGPSFGEVLNRVVGEVAQDVNVAETTARAGIVGQAGTREVVDAIMQAERSMQTAIAIRDKLVSGYHELSRMAI